MKLKLKELNANPFKKEINKGKLNEEQIKKIMSNMKELGLMGSLPVFKKDNKYYLVNGHHRVEALKRTYGKNFEVEVVVHNYDTSQTLRGMVIENLSQRGMDFREEIPNVLAVKKFLMQTVRTADSSKQTHKLEVGSREIAEWINGKIKDSVISKTRVCELMNINERIPQDIIESATHKQGSIIDTTKLRYDQLVSLSRIEDKEEIKEVAKALTNSENQRVNDHRKFVRDYKEAPEEVKEKVKSGDIDIANIEEAIVEHQIKQSNKGEHTEFIPNFETRLKDFGYNVAKLEQQVAIFRKVFGSNNFYSKYKMLGSKEKKFLDNSIYDIRKRIKKCYSEVEFFISKIEDKKLLEDKK